jgi:hypothetical protein
MKQLVGSKRPRAESKTKDDAFHKIYDGLSYQALASSDQPGAPHRFFKTSYALEPNHQVIHQHVNGVCVVTAGSDLLKDGSSITHVELKQTAAPSMSQGELRKAHSKLLRGKSVPHTVAPGDILAIATTSNGRHIHLCCAVWGTILEVNETITPQLLMDDPLLNGFLAVILPAGPFPPVHGDGEQESVIQKINGECEQEIN